VTDAPIAGWYPDPRNASAQWRWWNGRGWTDDTSPRTDVRRAPDWSDVAASPYRSTLSTAQTVRTTQTGGANTPWIWLLAFSAYIYGLVAGVLQGVGLVLLRGDAAMSQLVGAGALLIALIPLIVFADLDGRRLRERGLPAPSALWVVLLTPLVYFAVRARKLKKVGARSRGPEIALLIVVGVQVVGGILAIYLALTVLPFLPGGPSLY
jgi:hypothetical protein